MEACLYSVSCLTLLALYLLAFWFVEKVRFYSKVLLFVIYVVLFVPAFFIPVAMLRPKDARNYNIIMFTLRCLTRIYGIKFKIQGLEHVKKDESMVIVCNHQSEMDCLAMAALWPEVGLGTTIMKRELLFMGPYGLASYLCDSIYVDRSNPIKARASLDNAVSYLTHKNIKIWIYPEGTTSESGTLLPFKKGAFHMALQAQVPILPIVTSSYSSFYRSFFFNQTPKFDYGGQLTLQILPPVSTEGLTVKDIDPLIASVRQSMQESFDTISGFKTEAKSQANGTRQVTADNH